MPSGRKSFAHIKDKKIMMYKSKGEQDSYGEVLPTWEPVSEKPLWANYRSLSGNEVYAALTAGFASEVQFTINWRSDIEPGIHIVFRGKAYDVIRIDDLEGYKKDLILICKMLPHTDIEQYK